MDGRVGHRIEQPHINPRPSNNQTGTNHGTSQLRTRTNGTVSNEVFRVACPLGTRKYLSWNDFFF